MKLSPEQLKSLSECAIEAARAAGKHISETRPLNVQRKDSGDSLASQVLTEVDSQSQDLILDILKPTFAEFDLALLTEESPDDGSRLEKDYFWCIDPIDGTLPFIEGAPGYAVSIALVSREGVPQIGVAYDPVEHTLYHAINGQGAFRNLDPWILPEPGPTVRIFTDRSIAALPYCDLVAKELGAEVKGQGGAVMNAMWCLENPPACYFKFPKEEEGGGSYWDYAATACIFHEAGMDSSDIHGKALDLNQPETTLMNHGGILYATNRELAQRIMNLARR